MSDPGRDEAAPPRDECPVKEGELVGGKYRVERTLGMGGMGVVVAATHVQLEQKVALKFLLADAAENEDVALRFTREAKAAAKIQSEHVGRVMDVGTTESGAHFMVMEYLEGRDVAAILAEDGPLPVERAADYVLQACEAIAEAHAAGIVHRDLKPANLFLARRNDGSSIIKVLDFGISKSTVSRASLTGATDPALTNPSAVIGSPLYMSPEQLEAAPRVDGRADIWALGVILYEMVSCKTPFFAQSVPLIYSGILNNPPPPLADSVPAGTAVEPAFEAVVRRCLEKSPERRFTDVAELVTALVAFAPRQGRETAAKVSRLLQAVRSPAARPATETTEPVAPSENASTVTAWGPGRARPGVRKRTTLAVGAAAMLAGVVGVIVWGRGARDAEGPRVDASASAGVQAAANEAASARGAAPSTAAASASSAAAVASAATAVASASSDVAPRASASAPAARHSGHVGGSRATATPAAATPAPSASATTAPPSDQGFGDRE